MAIKLSTTLANLLTNGTFASPYSTGFLSIRTGTQPASPDSAVTGTELVAIALGSWGTAVNGVVSMTAPAVAVAVATGVAGWARLSDAALGNSIDGSVGVAGSGADFIVNAVSITSTQNVTVSTISLTLPKG